MTTITCPRGTLEFGPGRPLLLTNDQPRIMDQSPRVLEELLDGRIDMLVELARWGDQVGTDVAAVLLVHPEIDEVEWLPRVAVAIRDEVGCPVGLDTRNAEALEAGLAALQPYKAIHWTVTGEAEVLEALLPVVKRYGAVVCGMPMGRYSRHVPMTAEGRLAEARVIVEACQGIGIPRDDIMIDAVCMAASTLEPDAMRVALDAVQQIHDELRVTTQLGIGNAGHGMPDQTRFDLAHLLAAMPFALDTALVNPATEGLVECVRAMDFLLGTDPTGSRYLKHWRAKRRQPEYFWQYQSLVGKQPAKC
jgi:5-methyltetrahydrofolate--homocysteine methyltransferase